MSLDDEDRLDRGEHGNPIGLHAGITRGCLHCFAATMAHRLEAMGQAKYQGLTGAAERRATV